MIEYEEFKRRRAMSAIVAYLGGQKQGARINWCLGILTGKWGRSREEINLIIKEIEEDTILIRYPGWDERFKLLKEELKKVVQAP